MSCALEKYCLKFSFDLKPHSIELLRVEKGSSSIFNDDLIALT